MDNKVKAIGYSFYEKAFDIANFSTDTFNDSFIKPALLSIYQQINSEVKNGNIKSLRLTVEYDGDDIPINAQSIKEAITKSLPEDIALAVKDADLEKR